MIIINCQKICCASNKCHSYELKLIENYLEEGDVFFFFWYILRENISIILGKQRVIRYESRKKFNERKRVSRESGIMKRCSSVYHHVIRPWNSNETCEGL